MPYQEPFAVEEFLDTYEDHIEHNIGESCCYSLSLQELEDLTGEKFELNYNQRLTYGAIQGSHALRKLIAEMYSNEDVTLSEENVILTNGAIAANFLTHYTLAGKGDHFICISPTYQQLSSIPQMFGAEVELLHLRKETNYQPNIVELERMIKPNTKCIVLNTPNNPLSSVIPTKTLREIAELADKHGIVVFCDEVYSPLFHSCEKPKSLCQLSANGIVTGSMSKAYAAAGLRVGWIVSRNSEFLKGARSRRSFNTISVSMIDDAVSQYILRHREVVLKRNIRLCQDNLVTVKEFLKNSQDKFSFVHEPEGGAACLIRVHGVNDTNEFCAKLATDFKVLAAPGEAFGIPGSFRLGYGNSKEDLRESLKQLIVAYDQLVRK